MKNRPCSCLQALALQFPIALLASAAHATAPTSHDHSISDVTTVCLGPPVGSEKATRVEDIGYSHDAHREELDKVVAAVHRLLDAGAQPLSVRVICTSFVDSRGPSLRLREHVHDRLTSEAQSQVYADFLAGTARSHACKSALQARFAADAKFLASIGGIPAPLLLATVVQANEFSAPIEPANQVACPGERTGREVLISIFVEESPTGPMGPQGTQGSPGSDGDVGPAGPAGPAGKDATSSLSFKLLLHAGISGGMNNNFLGGGAGIGIIGRSVDWRLQGSALQSLEAGMVGLSVDSSLLAKNLSLGGSFVPLAGASATFVSVPWQEVSKPSTNVAGRLGAAYLVGAPWRLELAADLGAKVVHVSVLRGASEDTETRTSWVLGLSLRGVGEWHLF